MLRRFFIDFWSELLYVIRDIKNFFFLAKVCRSAETTPEWREHRLRRDWVYRIYKVEYLENEYTALADDMKKTVLIQKVMPVFDYLTDLGIHEIIRPEFQKLKEEGNYLLVFRHLFVGVSFSFWVRFFLWSGIIWWAATKFDYNWFASFL